MSLPSASTRSSQSPFSWAATAKVSSALLPAGTSTTRSRAAPSVLLDEPEDIQFVDRDHVGRMPVGMLLPTGALIAVGLTLTVLAGPIFAYSGRAANEVLDRQQYISAVMGK